LGRLNGKTIVITGASSGIGRAIAIACAAEGAAVVNGDVRPDPREGGAATDELIVSRGQSARYVQTDVSRQAEVDRLFDFTLDEFGRVDGLVNNAIYYGEHNKSILATTEADWDAMVDVGLRGVFLCSKRALECMLEQEPAGEVRGRVINMASQVGFLGAPGSFTSCVIKGGVVNLTRQLAVEFGGERIAVNAIAPGKILTTPLDAPDPPEVIEYAKLRTPYARLGEPEDVAGMAAFLLSDECTFTTGAIIPVDGGWLAAF
jgi:NAD(P)-dependent dehydrogenase (short-subunit alcohol dehydrogenase family)